MKVKEAANITTEKIMPKRNNRHKRKLPLTVVLTYLIVVTLVATGVSLSSYVTTASGEDTVRVAVMANSVSVNLSTSVLPIAPGEEKIIQISISNFEENNADKKVCEVAQEYKLNVESMLIQHGASQSNLPLKWAIYTNADCTQQAPVGADQKVVGTFSAGEEQTKTYWIKFVWPADASSANYVGELDAYQLMISAEQLD